MAVIPRKLYAYVEKKLYEQPYEAVCAATEKLIECKAEASGVKSPGADRAGGRSGAISNRVQDGVLSVIAAEENLEIANRWAYVLSRLSAIFEGKPEAEIAEMMYRQKLSMRDIACMRGVDRQTIRRLRDSYVACAALLAAENGLVRMSEFEE